MRCGSGEHWAGRPVTEMGAVDTGNLRATIVAAPTVAEALAEATTRALDAHGKPKRQPPTPRKAKEEDEELG